MSTPVNFSTPLNSTPLNSTNTTVQYFITADADPAALPRVLELFAMRGITPDLVKVCQYKQHSFPAQNLSIDIHVAGLSAAEQDIIYHKLGAQVAVQNVRQENLYQKVPQQLAS